jgi:hypothetical protein
MSDSIFDDWRYRYSRLYQSAGKWRFFVNVEANGFTTESKPWHWWNPAHLVRRVIHLLWVRKYW